MGLDNLLEVVMHLVIGGIASFDYQDEFLIVISHNK